LATLSYIVLNLLYWLACSQIISSIMVVASRLQSLCLSMVITDIVARIGYVLHESTFWNWTEQSECKMYTNVQKQILLLCGSKP